MNCLVTGAAGFIGYHLCQRLLAEGATVLGVDNLNSYYEPQLKRDRLSSLGVHNCFDFLRVELADRFAVDALFQNERFDVVFHLAAQAGVRYSIENPDAYVQSNLVAFVNILENCRRNGPPHFIYASSSSVYGSNKKIPFSTEDRTDNPVSLYAATKRSNELIASTYAHLHGMSIVGLRLFTVYGPWGRPDMAMYKFADAMTQGRPIDVYNHGAMRRDFTYVDDIVAGICRAANVSRRHASDERGIHRLYNLGGNQPVELSELISLLEETLGVTAERRMLPMQPGDVHETFADISQSANELGFCPRTSLQDGVASFVRWYRSYHPDLSLAAAR